MKSRLEKFKEKLPDGEKKVVMDYEDSISDLLEDLDNRGVLKIVFTEWEVDRLQNLVTTSNAPIQLWNSFNNVFKGSSQEMKENVDKLAKVGFKTNPYHFLTVMCHSYQVTSERLKMHLVTIIDFDALGLKNPDSKPLGPLLHKLKQEFPKNKFIDYLDTNIRNAVTHYTYYFDQGQLHLCNGYFDPNPTTMSLAEFMMESKKLIDLTESLFIIYLDKYFTGGDLHLDNF